MNGGSGGAAVYFVAMLLFRQYAKNGLTSEG